MPQTFTASRSLYVWPVGFLIVWVLSAQIAGLHIKVVAGDGTSQAAGTSVAKPVTVEVTDTAGRPVEGARVSFQAPEEGPGGVFSNGLRTDVAVTDSNGRATVRGLQLNRIAGPFRIRITAAKEQARAGTLARYLVTEANSAIRSADRKAPRPTLEIKTAVDPVAPGPPAESGTVKKGEAAPKTPLQTTKAAASTKSTIVRNIETGPVRRKVAGTASPLIAAAAPILTGEKAGRIATIVYTGKTLNSAGGAVSVGSSHKSHKKLIVLVVVAGGVAGALAGARIGGALGQTSAIASAPLPPISIGTPTITIGKP